MGCENKDFYKLNPKYDERIESAVEYDPDQGERIIGKYITEELAKKFFAMFWGRIDVYAKRGKNGGYFPQCNHRWNDRICPKQRGEKIACENCEHVEWTALTPKKIMEHLLGYKEDGSDVIGVYPLLAEGTCRFLFLILITTKKARRRRILRMQVRRGTRKRIQLLRQLSEEALRQLRVWFYSRCCGGF